MPLADASDSVSARSQSKKANFDATHELEELLLEENPLKARKRKENQDPANLSPDMRTMETHAGDARRRRALETETRAGDGDARWRRA